MNVQFSQDEIDKTFVKYAKNEVITGYIVMINENGFVLNIGGKKDAFIYNEDIEDKQSYNVDDSITGIIVETKDENGFIKISQKEYELRKRSEETFNSLHIGKNIEVIPSKVVTGGIIAKYYNFNVFIPQSHLEFKAKKDPSIYLNKPINVIIIQIDVRERKIVASIKNLIEQKKQELDNDFWSKIEEGMIVEGTVKKLAEFGAFVNVFGKDCLIRNKEVGYFNEKAQDVFKLQENYKFIVISADRESGKVLLGYKQLKDDPRIELYKKYEIGKNYVGKVVKIFAFGVVIELEENVSGFLHISDAEYGLINMNEAYKIGKEYLVKIKGIDFEKNKISLERRYDYEYEVK